MCMKTTCMEPADQIENHHGENSRVFLNTNFSELQSLFAMTQEVILSLEAIQVSFEMNTVNWVRTPSWKCTLANDKPLQWSKAKACVFPDSMLCLHGRCQPYLESAEACEGEELTGVWFLFNFVSLDDINGELVVFEWKILPGHTTHRLVEEVRKKIEEELKIELESVRETHHLHVYVQRHRLLEKGQWRYSKEQFIGCFRVCRMFSWRKLDVSRTRQRRDGGLVLAKCQSEDRWDYYADEVVAVFRESGHPIFRGPIPLSRGTLMCKDKKTSPHFPYGNPNCRVIATHYCCRQSAQYLRSSSGLVRRTYSASSRLSFRRARGDPLRGRLMMKLLKFPLTLCRFLPKVCPGTPKPRETRCGNTMKSSKTYQKTLGLK